MHLSTLLGILFVAGLKELRAQDEGCPIAINGGGLPNPQPLLLNRAVSGDGYGFLLPTDSNGIVGVQKHTKVRIACPGPSNYIVPLGRDTQQANVTCVGDGDFTARGVRSSFRFREFYCKIAPLHTARRAPSGAVCTNGKMNEIGFIVGRGFFKTIDVCFDRIKKNVLWSMYQLVAVIGGYQSGFPSPLTFNPGPFYRDIDVAVKYTRQAQQDTVSAILGSNALGRKYINMSHSSNFFLARGHLTAKADFVYGSQQAAAFYYINVAPQWQTFNGGNWNTMENDVRNFASSNHLDLIVYTGTYGVITLPDVNGMEQEIWLSVDANNNKAIPVPKVFWKVVYDSKTRKAIAFLGVNNPYVSRHDRSYFICADICANGEVPWLSWAKDIVKLGISYCCAIDAEFRIAVRALPRIPVSGVLT